MNKINIIFAFLLTTCSACLGGEKHLFILSGQSNMAGMKPELFASHVNKAFGEENVIVVHSAKNGRPIRQWDKGWQLEDGQNAAEIGVLYNILIESVKKEIEGKLLASVTFCWMQGERDARERLSEKYEESFKRLLAQLRDDLGRKDIHLVIGRLSDSAKDFGKNPHWEEIRRIQMKLADDHEGAWIDTDDLNDGVDAKGNPLVNDLHYSVKGYELFGKRMADQAVRLIREKGKKGT